MKYVKITPPYITFIAIFLSMLPTTKILAQNALTTPNAYTFWNAEMQAIAKPESKPGWIYFKDDFNTPVQDILYQLDAGFDYNLTLTSNPASDNVQVCFNLPSDAVGIKLKLIDEYNQVGMLLHEKVIQENELCKEFNVRSYSNGTYRVVLEHDGAVAAGKHLLIAR